MRVHNNKSLSDRRKELRQKSTPEETVLWEELRNNKLGVRFRRQHSIGGYILDFYCFSKHLIIEVDGKSHESMKKYDAVRDTYFSDLGYLTLRLKNEDVQSSLQTVIEKIKDVLKHRPSPRR
jgi:leucyl-tRNA synthetase